MFEHTAAIVQFHGADENFSHVRVDVVAGHTSYSTRARIGAEVNIRQQYRQACALARLHQCGMPMTESNSIVMLSFQTDAQVQELHPLNVHRILYHQFRRRKLTERRASERKALHVALEASVQTWCDYTGKTWMDARRDLRLPNAYLDGVGSNPTFYVKLVERIQDELERMEWESQSRSEQAAEAAVEAYYENRGEPMDERELEALERFEAQLAASPNGLQGAAGALADEIPF